MEEGLRDMESLTRRPALASSGSSWEVEPCRGEAARSTRSCLGVREGVLASDLSEMVLEFESGAIVDGPQVSGFSRS